MRTLCVAARHGDAGRVRVLLAGIALSQRDVQASSFPLPEDVGGPERTGAGARERGTCARGLSGPDA
jgi:hypothetical protein